MNTLSTDERLAICDKCPIYTKGRCNYDLWLNPNTNDVSTYAKSGYIRGCNCICSIKARNPYNHCIAHKW